MGYKNQDTDHSDELILGSRPGEYLDENGQPSEESFSGYADIDEDFDLDEDQYLGDKEGPLSSDHVTHPGGIGGDGGRGVGHIPLIPKTLNPKTGIPRPMYVDLWHYYQNKRHTCTFDPTSYSFDKNIREALKSPLLPFMKPSKYHDAIDNPEAQDYEAYKPIADNIAMVRMAVYSHYFPEGPDSPKAPATLKKINDISRTIAQEMKWQARWSRVVSIVTLGMVNKGSKTVDRFGKYGDPHHGAKSIYEMLYKSQEQTSLNPIKWMMGQATKEDWGLPSPEDWSFSQNDMQAIIAKETGDTERGIENTGHALANMSVQIESIASQTGLNGVAQMDRPQRAEAVEHARDILRRLRELQPGSSERVQDARDKQSDDLERGDLLVQLAEQYQNLYDDLLAQDASIQVDSTFERARIALGKLGHLVSDDAIKHLNTEGKRDFKAVIDKIPENFKQVAADNEADLLRDVESAFTELTTRYNSLAAPAPAAAAAFANAQNVRSDMENTMHNVTIGASSKNISQHLSLSELAANTAQMEQQRSGSLASDQNINSAIPSAGRG